MVYILHAEGTNRYKIGYTQNNDATKRVKSIQTGCPFPVLIVKIFENESQDYEYSLHARFSNNRKIGEWFEFSELEMNDYFSYCPIRKQKKYSQNSLDLSDKNKVLLSLSKEIQDKKNKINSLCTEIDEKHLCLIEMESNLLNSKTNISGYEKSKLQFKGADLEKWSDSILFNDDHIFFVLVYALYLSIAKYGKGNNNFISDMQTLTYGGSTNMGMGSEYQYNAGIYIQENFNVRNGNMKVFEWLLVSSSMCYFKDGDVFIDFSIMRSTLDQKISKGHDIRKCI